MTRSSRLALLIGALFAVAAFVGLIVVFNQRSATTGPSTPTTLPTVYAKRDISLGTVILSDMVETRELSVTVRPADAFGDTGLVVGKTVRTDVVANALLTPAVFTSSVAGGADIAALLDPGFRAIAVVVNQTSGVGTLINVGDRVDIVISLSGDKIPQLAQAPSPSRGAPTPAPGAVTPPPLTQIPFSLLNNTSTKLLVQDMEVIGTLLPPAPTASGAQPVTFGEGQELVILAVTPQQAEVIKFAQIDAGVTLVLRSPKDFRDEAGNPLQPSPAVTTGIILKTLIDQYGVLPPDLIIRPDTALFGPFPTPTPTPVPTPPPAPSPSPSPSPSA